MFVAVFFIKEHFSRVLFWKKIDDIEAREELNCEICCNFAKKTM
jgi:hypothetical protein